MTAGVGCKCTVHFSISFFTTRTSFPKNPTLLSCRRSHSRLRHFLDDFGERLFGRLFLGFLFAHGPHDVTGANRSQVNLDQAHYFLACYSDTGAVTTFSSFRSSDLSQSI